MLWKCLVFYFHENKKKFDIFKTLQKSLNFLKTTSKTPTKKRIVDPLDCLVKSN